jgi:hypothetical protein
MRAILLVLILAVVGLIILIATGLLDINQTKPAEAPQLSVTENGVVAEGGQAPAFDVETGTVSVGSEAKNVTVAVPTVQVNRADGNQAQPATNTAQ